MIEKESDNVESKETNISEEENFSENTSLIEEPINQDKELSNDDDQKINAEDLKNTISNNDARLEHLEKDNLGIKMI